MARALQQLFLGFLLFTTKIDSWDIILSSDDNPKEGSPVNLTCYTAKDPRNGHVKFIHNGKVFSDCQLFDDGKCPSNILQDNSTTFILMIDSINANHRGWWKCAYHNPSNSLFLNVTGDLNTELKTTVSGNLTAELKTTKIAIEDKGTHSSELNTTKKPEEGKGTHSAELTTTKMPVKDQESPCYASLTVGGITGNVLWFGGVLILKCCKKRNGHFTATLPIIGTLLHKRHIFIMVSAVVLFLCVSLPLDRTEYAEYCLYERGLFYGFFCSIAIHLIILGFCYIIGKCQERSENPETPKEDCEKVNLR